MSVVSREFHIYAVFRKNHLMVCNNFHQKLLRFRQRQISNKNAQTLLYVKNADYVCFVLVAIGTGSKLWLMIG